MFEHRLALAMHEPDVEKLKHDLTYEQWSNWEQFYEQDPWGELRSDMRQAAAVLTSLNPKTEVSMFFPYFESHDDVDDEASYQQLQAEIAAIGQEKIQEQFRKGREAHLAKKKANG